ncbi:MAG TPA: 50S ribosomal protein L15 [Candidatus Woesearchaeota archaeon]|nr:50S ribosomal protein L15 [Candidatus Woesearchaeota archaeon]
MTIRKIKKSRKARGKNSTHGSGKRNRGAGNRGGRGRAGLGKRAGHRKLKFLLEGTKLGVHGFTSVKQKHHFHPNSINLGWIDKSIDNLINAKLAEKTAEGIKIDVKKIGYTKLLGGGRVNNKLLLTVLYATESAVRKVEEAGGKVTLG